jgi:hypothetical protein
VGTLKMKKFLVYLSNIILLQYVNCTKYGFARLLDYFQGAVECSGYTHHLENRIWGHFSHYKGRDNQVVTVFYANMASTSKVYTKGIVKLQGNPMSKNMSPHEWC